MASDGSGCRGSCSECRYLVLDAKRSRLRCEVFGEHPNPAHCCHKPHFSASAICPQSIQQSSSVGRSNYERVSINGR